MLPTALSPLAEEIGLNFFEGEWEGVRLAGVIMRGFFFLRFSGILEGVWGLMLAGRISFSLGCSGPGSVLISTIFKW